MTALSLLTALECFAGARIVCIGDVMLDRFIYGEVERISPEAPIPVLRITSETSMLGGVGNVARNLVAMGAEPRLVTVVGDDQPGHEVVELIANSGGIQPDVLVVAGRCTTVKNRFVAGTQQLLRADAETSEAIEERTIRQLAESVTRLLEQSTALVLSDYAKGALPPRLVRGVIEAARAAGRSVVVDPKGSEYGRYAGASVLTPNRAELALATGMPVDSDAAIVSAARTLIERYGIGAIAVTRSRDGLSLVTGDDVVHFRAEAREVFDVSGAGDTVVGVLAVALSQGIELAVATELANIAGGLAVGKIGTATVTIDELAEAARRKGLLAGSEKVVTAEQATQRLDTWRRAGLRIGFTNGCFDLLHPGHVSLMGQARAACDRLVVGLNSDESVRRLKGETRPVQNEAARAIVLSSLSTVDLVVVFGEDTPMRLLETLRPDVLVKGADYAREQVVGGDFVESYGGRVVLADLTPGQSTTGIVRRMSGDSG